MTNDLVTEIIDGTTVSVVTLLLNRDIFRIQIRG